ncbi:hypothetical protein HYC85_005546 [Camellia sinensis]|uniref:Uncharacterized protein n=1 Tax=Camellia sinensis TaxID=4442 RepID=A0A7J7I1B9_CAMSI|nr:hypothetical protein HYC85_005546 [Camellia sinensis]
MTPYTLLHSTCNLVKNFKHSPSTFHEFPPSLLQNNGLISTSLAYSRQRYCNSGSELGFIQSGVASP